MKELREVVKYWSTILEVALEIESDNSFQNTLVGVVKELQEIVDCMNIKYYELKTNQGLYDCRSYYTSLTLDENYIDALKNNEYNCKFVSLKEISKKEYEENK